MQIDPDEHFVAAICRKHLGEEVSSISRFPTGLCHYVFDVSLRDGRKVVARIARESERKLIAGGIGWSKMLRPMGVPLPEILAADPMAEPWAFMLLERIPGTDLGNVYPQLTVDQRREIARAVAGIQERVSSLPKGSGYGYVTTYDQAFPHATWRGAISSLERPRNFLKAGGVIGPEVVDRVAAALPGFEGLLDKVEPTPFLDDVTTKNVIIHEGKLAGIVDVDELCFGDSLFTVALTRMSLLAWQYSTDYIDAWTEAIGLDADGRQKLDLYTAIHCINFMGEVGQAFNRPSPPPVDYEYVGRLRGILDRLI